MGIELKDNKILTEENNALKVKNNALSSEIKSKQDEIDDLKESNFSLKYSGKLYENGKSTFIRRMVYFMLYCS